MGLFHFAGDPGIACKCQVLNDFFPFKLFTVWVARVFKFALWIGIQDAFCNQQEAKDVEITQCPVREVSFLAESRCSGLREGEDPPPLLFCISA